MGGGRVSRRLGSEKTARKRWENSRSGENLIGIYEISPNSTIISLDLMRFCQIRSKSHQIYVKYCLNMGFLVEIWVFFAKFWNFTRRDLGFSPKFGFFTGIWVFLRLVRVFRDRNRNRPARVSFWGRRPAADHWNSRVGRFQIGSSWVLRVGRVSDGFG